MCIRDRKKQLEDLVKQQNLNNILDKTPVMELTSEDFNREMTNNDLLLVDFWAEWCGPCKMIGPVVEELAGEFDGKAVIGKVDVDANPNLSVEFGVRSIPTLLFFKDGEVVDKQIGAVPKSILSNKLEAQLA